MTCRQLNRQLLECDGCGTQHDPPDGHPSATEARAAAYVDGWRFPPKMRANGTPAHRTSDVCPSCLPTWTPSERRIQEDQPEQEASTA